MTTARQYMKAGSVVREAECPFGHGSSTDFQGVSEGQWVFLCVKKHANRHNFVAEPDSKAPKTVEEIAAWMKRHQRVAKKTLA